MGTAYLAISRLSKNFAVFLKYAVQCILENNAANDQLLSSFLCLKKLKVINLLKYSVETDRLKEKLMRNLYRL